MKWIGLAAAIAVAVALLGWSVLRWAEPARVHIGYTNAPLTEAQGLAIEMLESLLSITDVGDRAVLEAAEQIALDQGESVFEIDGWVRLNPDPAPWVARRSDPSRLPRVAVIMAVPWTDPNGGRNVLLIYNDTGYREIAADDLPLEHREWMVVSDESTLECLRRLTRAGD